MGPPWKRAPLRGPRGVQPLRIYLTLMIEIKSSMSADKIKGPIVIFTKAKKNSHAPQGLELLDLSWELPTGLENIVLSQKSLGEISCHEMTMAGFPTSLKQPPILRTMCFSAEIII